MADEQMYILELTAQEVVALLAVIKFFEQTCGQQPRVDGFAKWSGVVKQLRAKTIAAAPDDVADFMKKLGL